MFHYIATKLILQISPILLFRKKGLFSFLRKTKQVQVECDKFKGECNCEIMQIIKPEKQKLRLLCFTGIL